MIPYQYTSRLYQYNIIEYRDISYRCIDIKTVYLYVYSINMTDAVVVYYVQLCNYLTSYIVLIILEKIL